MKFKVGDKVKILRKDDTFGWDQDMARDIGCTFLLDEPCGDAGWYINGYIWSEDNLEIVSAAQKELITEVQEPLYTIEEVFNAIQELTSTGAPLDLDAIKIHLSRKSDLQYLEYIRLKAIYEG
jgi:hypothetical protein